MCQYKFVIQVVKCINEHLYYKSSIHKYFRQNIQLCLPGIENQPTSKLSYF